MKRFKIFVLCLLMCAVSFPAISPQVFAAVEEKPQAKNKNPFGDTPWKSRCQKGSNDADPKRGRCEIYKTMVYMEKKQRLVEVAVSFPKEKESARGVFIVPLGVLLQSGLQMKIDDGKPFKFQVRYCDKGGCFGFVDLNEQILDSMRKGEKMTVSFQAINQKSISVELSLKNFAKALKEVS